MKKKSGWMTESKSITARLPLLVVHGHQHYNSQASKEDCESQEDANNRPNEAVVVAIVLCQVVLD